MHWHRGAKGDRLFPLPSMHWHRGAKGDRLFPLPKGQAISTALLTNGRVEGSRADADGLQMGDLGLVSRDRLISHAKGTVYFPCTGTGDGEYAG